MPLENFKAWIFNEEIDTPSEITQMIRGDEKVFKSFKTVRDVASFTDKRLIVIDSQGLTGKKKDGMSTHY